MRKNRFIRKLPVTLAMACIGLMMLSPLVIIFTNSLMTEQEISFNYGLLGKMPSAEPGQPVVFVNLKLIPDWLSFDQYWKVLIDTPTYLFMFWNSVAIVAAIISGQTIVSALAAYAFAKLRFKGREGWFRVYLMTMLMPFQVTLVPNYIIVDQLGLMNTVGAIILPGIFAAFGVFMLRQFMLSIPYALVEAAQIDGAGHYRIFYQIMLPLMKQGIAALIVLLFVDYWNMVEQPLIFLKDAFKQPLSLYLSTIHKEAQGIGYAASLIYMAPMVLLFVKAESYFVEGVQMSGIKG